MQGCCALEIRLSDFIYFIFGFLNIHCVGLNRHGTVVLAGSRMVELPHTTSNIRLTVPPTNHRLLVVGEAGQTVVYAARRFY